MRPLHAGMIISPYSRGRGSGGASAIDSEVLHVDGRDVTLSHPDKLLWRDLPVTKRDLLHYYVTVAPYLLPHLAGRPLVRCRMPEGIEGGGFWEKELPDFAPPWLTRWVDARSSRRITYPVIEDLSSLLWVANSASIELHPWLSRTASPDEPDVAVFDLDPAPPAGFREAVEIALLLHQALESLGLASYPKTSGATGLQIYVPLAPGHSYATTRRFVRLVGQLVSDAYPERITWEWSVRARAGRVRIDFTQNVRGKTIASVYSVRPLPGAPASTPLRWEEVGPDLDPAAFTLRTLPERVRNLGDLFSAVLTGGQRLDGAMELLGVPLAPAK